MDDKVEDIYWCEKREGCQWKCFALDYHGMSLGIIENHLSAWIEAHEHFCGGKLIQGKIVQGLI